SHSSNRRTHTSSPSHTALLHSFLLLTPRPPRSTLFPYTTLFRSDEGEKQVLPDVEQRRPAQPARTHDPPKIAADEGDAGAGNREDRKSTRLNSSHGYISYAVFCLKKKKHITRARCST